MAYLLIFLKGVAMGAANVIPGVSGGTIALVTGIYERFIDALKSFDIEALRLAAKFRFRELFSHLDLAFLIPLGLGLGVSLISLGKLLDWLFTRHPVLVWSFFFGLILASIYYVAQSIKRWNPAAVSALVVGAAIAVALAFFKPAAENDNLVYLVICGIVAISSMILPGLSGSFVLILMGNYQLVILRGVPNFDFRIVLPFAVGAAIGFIALSHLISYLLRRFHDATLAILTGFILGSLVVIWPWKNEVHLLDEFGQRLLKDDNPIVQGYEWTLPALDSLATWAGLGLMVIGVASVVLLEKTASRK